MKIVSKSSFTLFELLIVILIISILYGIFIQKISSKEHIAKKDALLHLNDILQDYDFNESAKIVCISKCKDCYIQVDGKRKRDIDLFDKEVKVYDFDIHGLLSQIKFVPVFDKEGNPLDVCFSYTLYPNGSNSSYIVEYKDRFYVYYAYMRPVKVVNTISDAQEAFDPSPWIPTDSSEYNF